MTSIYNDNRITLDHLAREAIVYVRQSSPEQVLTRKESATLQRRLRESAINLGWPNPIIIDDDQGISAAGFSDRPGFQVMLAKVASKKVGIIISWDSSRLSRNCKDWGNLLELCSFFNTLIADFEQVYDLTRPNDRLLMGIKGTVSELELSILKSRLRAGIVAKAERGELRVKLPPGYSYNSSGNIDFDPDIRIQKSIQQMFLQFDKCKSVRQLAMWYKDTKTLFPVRNIKKDGLAQWRTPTASTLLKLFNHPVYAGAYVYGRRHYYVEYSDERLKKRVGRYLEPKDCKILLYGHHPAYISWEQLEVNLAKLAENKPRWNMLENRGAVRDGLALLAGMLRCGHCGGKLYVSYKETSALYYCDGGQVKGSKRCLAFGSNLIDQRVGDELCRALEPIAVEASIEAVRRDHRLHFQAIEAAQMAVQAAQYAADRAFEQFDLADPKNRLVTDTLESRLNERLADLQDAKNRLDACKNENILLTADEEAEIHQLAKDFPTVWHEKKIDPALKKRLLRAAIHEILVSHDSGQQQLEVTIHWQGGAHTRILVKKRITPRFSKAEPDLIALVKSLAGDGLVDSEIARILNMQKRPTPHGLLWTQSRVDAFRKHHRIKKGTLDSKGVFFTKSEAADYLGISHNGVLGLERIGAIQRAQVTDFAPWRIPKEALDSEHVQGLVRALKETGRLPRGGCSKDQPDLFLEK